MGDVTGWWAHHTGGGAAIRIVIAEDSVLLRATAYAVDASSSRGDTRVKIKTDQESKHRVKLRSSGGGVTADYPAAD